MSEARALTNFAGNAVATVLVGTWTKEIDKDRVNEVLAGRLPFDEKTLVDDAAAGRSPRRSSAADVGLEKTSAKVDPGPQEESGRAPDAAPAPSPQPL